MKLDFTIERLKELYCALREAGYAAITFYDFLKKRPQEKFCILRHDVDTCVENALRVAELEKELGVTATYFFRYGKVFIPTIITEIFKKGHEIGYHYETLSRTRGDYVKAIDLFKDELEEFRKIVPIKTICAHGSPLSRWDNRTLWERYDFRDFEIVGDAYCSINFDEVLYLTDTGRSWDKRKGNVRDKVPTKFHYRFHATNEIIRAITGQKLPNKIMLNIHPNRWSDHLLKWSAEFVGQNIKNMIKDFLYR